VKIIVIGCGKIGEELAGVLSHEGNDITIIDKNEQVVQTVCDRYDVMGVVGNGASYPTQLEAEVGSADLMIAVTGSDELNLLCCLIAKKAGNCSTIARVRNPEYNTEVPFLKEELGLAMIINQEQTAASEIARILRVPSAIEVTTFARGRVELLRLRIPEKSEVDGLSLVEMHHRLNANVLVCTVQRDGQIVIPNGNYILRSGDDISIVCEADAEKIFFRHIGIRQQPVRRVMIIGGGDIAYYLAEALSAYGMSVKIIEKKFERCEFLSEKMPRITVIHGDGSSRELLEEEDLGSCDAVVTLTGIDEENVILSLYAKQSGVRKVITKINHITFKEVIDSLNLDSTIEPRHLTAEYILQYVRARRNASGSNMETLHKIIDGRAEAIEFTIKDDFKRKNISLQALPIRKNVLIACITRDGKIIQPRGADVLLPGDSVVVVTVDSQLDDIDDIFEDR
jgi:trk system potassium uptake protein TrkA